MRLAICANHPERRASIECPHCGSFACVECTVDTDWGDAMCEGCLAHGRAQYPLPWEQSASPVAFVHSAYLVLADTRTLFGALPHGRVGRALLFATLVGLPVGAISCSRRGCSRRRRIGRRTRRACVVC